MCVLTAIFDSRTNMQQPEPKQTIATLGPLEPVAVSIPEARRLLGGKSRSQLYSDIGSGKLEALKDGVKTLITLESIRAYMAGLPPAKIKPPTPPRSHRRQKR
jgi:hypothetical protein